jgi:preprotein translocase subunit SecE
MAVNAKAGSSGGSNTPGSPDQSIKRTQNFVQETIVELKKTHWPTRQEAWRLTMVVIAVIVVLGVYMGILDLLLTKIVEKFSLIK